MVDFSYITPYFPELRDGFVVTFQLTVFGMLFGLVLGIFLAIGDLYGDRYLSGVIKIYVEFFRGSALISQLFIFYFTIPMLLNIQVSNEDSFKIGLLVFGLNSAGYQKGYIKGAMESVYMDQMTAALSLGMTKVQAIRHVVLPQALRIVIPSWSNEFASITKSTAAILVIGGARDLTTIGSRIASQTFRFFETFGFIAIIYLIWITIVMKALDILYNRVKIPGIELMA